MSTEYSVEECLRLANACVTRGQTVDLSAVSLYLTAYAERIEADERAVPDGWADVYAAFKGAFDTPAAWLKDNSEYANDARKRLREFNEAMLAAAPSAPEAIDAPDSKR